MPSVTIRHTHGETTSSGCGYWLTFGIGVHARLLCRAAPGKHGVGARVTHSQTPRGLVLGVGHVGQRVAARLGQIAAARKKSGAGWTSVLHDPLSLYRWIRVPGERT